MTAVIYIDNQPHRPWKRFQEVEDDWGTTWKAKMGTQIAHHWARLRGEFLLETKEPMSQWHLDWQNKLEKDCGMRLEICKRDAHRLRRADALCEDKKIVVEVQYSYISSADLLSRSIFWSDLGFQVVWVFAYPKIDQHHQHSKTNKISAQPFLEYWEKEWEEHKRLRQLLKWEIDDENEHRAEHQQYHSSLSWECNGGFDYSRQPSYLEAARAGAKIFLEGPEGILYKVTRYTPYRRSIHKWMREAPFKHGVRFEEYEQDSFISYLNAPPI